MTTWTCSVCGYSCSGEHPPAPCPECGAPGIRFRDPAGEPDLWRTRAAAGAVPWEGRRAEKATAPPRQGARAVDVDKVLAELDGMIGLAEVKRSVRALAETIQFQKERAAKGLPGLPQAIHIVFTGNPGTGKTTVARKLGALFKAMGLLPTDKVVETDRSALVGQYVGQTAPLVNEVCDSALGGILFIDEAYSLANDANGGFGREAIDALLKRMEDDRGKFVVIAAGYQDEMDAFIRSNPGLRSRFTHFLHLADYTAGELFAIFASMAEANGYELSPGAAARAKSVIENIHRNKEADFSNGRAMRNLFDAAIRNMAGRTRKLGKAQRTARALSVIMAEDISE